MSPSATSKNISRNHNASTVFKANNRIPYSTKAQALGSVKLNKTFDLSKQQNGFSPVAKSPVVILGSNPGIKTKNSQFL